MGLIFAFFVARVPEIRMRAIIIAAASIVLGYLATKINGESLVHILFDAPQVALASVVGIMLLQRYKPEWIGREAVPTSAPARRD
jgi:hypothetical protein